jgi:hypothetical protein
MKTGDWEKLKKKLDRKAPPASETIIVKPGETINFEGFARFNIPKIRDEYPLTSIPSQNMSLLQTLSPLEIHLDCETWTTLPLLGARESAKSDFSGKLRTKWSEHGYLWTEHIDSEPISINFNSLIYKNLVD